MELKISQIPSTDDKFTIKAIVYSFLTKKTTKSSTIGIYQIADETGSIEFGMYDGTLNTGDIVLISNAYKVVKENRLRVFAGTNRNIRRISTFRMLFKTEPNYSDLDKVDEQ